MPERNSKKLLPTALRFDALLLYTNSVFLILEIFYCALSKFGYTDRLAFFETVEAEKLNRFFDILKLKLPVRYRQPVSSSPSRQSVTSSQI